MDRFLCQVVLIMKQLFDSDVKIGSQEI
jgi:hypothetical protein